MSLDESCVMTSQVSITKSVAGRSARETEVSADETRDVAGRVWGLATDVRGCRRVQRALDEAGNDEQRIALASEFRGHVWEALRCQHANHVLQRCITALPPQASQFIVEELMAAGPGSGASAARHRFGCRVLERLLEHCLPKQISILAADVLAQATELCVHPFANYVMQHLVEHGTADQASQVADALVRGAPAGACGDFYGCAVVGKVLRLGSRLDRAAVGAALLQVPGLAVSMARQRHGHVAVKALLRVETAEVYNEARRQLTAEIEAIQNSRYGRMVVTSLGKSAPERSCAATCA